MSSQEYAPGTVAVATVRGSETARIVRGVRADEFLWYQCTGSYRWLTDADVTDVRPLVALDLGSHRPAAVGLLRYAAENDASSPAATDLFSLIADQIKAQTKPPKPPEPTGLGAVVEDANGVHWLRMPGWPGTDYAPWASAAKERDRFDRKYDAIDAVKVLSEGVTA